MSTEKKTNRVIFDNGGSVTVQIGSWTHTCSDPEEAADLVLEAIIMDDVDDWEGHDEDAIFDPTVDELARGGYCVWDIGDEIDDSLRNWGGNTEIFFMCFAPVTAKLDREEKIEQAQNLLDELRDDDNAPMDPHLRVSFETGAMGVESDLNEYARREYSLGQTSDLGDWIPIDDKYNDDDLVALYDTVYSVAMDQDKESYS